MNSDCYIALGSNLGDSAAILRTAMDGIQSLSVTPIRRSSLWQSTPVDCPPGSPMFVNAVVGLTALRDETPESLLVKLQSLEKEAGRRPKAVLNEPRPLDLDIVAWGDFVCQTPDLILPHPRAHQRRFVLEPLAEIAPELRLPGQLATVRELLVSLRSDEVLRRVG